MTAIEIAKELKQCSAWSWADGEYLTVININWRTGAEIGEPHQLLRFKAAYRYNFLQGRKNEP